MSVFFLIMQSSKASSSCQNVVFSEILVSFEKVAMEDTTFIKLWLRAMEETPQILLCTWESYAPHGCGEQYEFNSGISRMNK